MQQIAEQKTGITDMGVRIQKKTAILVSQWMGVEQCLYGSCEQYCTLNQVGIVNMDYFALNHSYMVGGVVFIYDHRASGQVVGGISKNDSNQFNKQP